MTVVGLVESTKLTEAATDAPSGKFRARLIEANVWGSSGYYSGEVLETAAADQIFGQGTPIFMDHPGAEEKYDRPERSVRDLAGKLTSDAVFEADGLYADIEVYPHVAPIIAAIAEDIGMSIRAGAEVSEGEAAGRSGRIIERFTDATSVDFVTRAGAGGKVVNLRESATINHRAIRRGVAEATVNDQREALDDVLKSAYGADKTWVWLRDFDETTAWFEVSTDDSEKTYSQAYTSGEDGLATAMTGERTEVRQVTQYVPVSSAGQSTTKESEEDTMPQIEEARLRQLEADAGRVTALESERDKHQREAEEAASKVSEAERRANVAEARLTASSVARARVVAENDDLAPATVDRVVNEALRDVPLTESGELDETKLHEQVDKAREAEESYLAGLQQATGAGTPTGFGKSNGGDGAVSESDIDKAIAGSFGRTIKEG